MYALKRIAAYVIDMLVVITPVQFLSLDVWLEKVGALPPFFASYIWIIQTGLPVLILGVCVGVFGKSPGKLVMFLKVVNGAGRPPGLPQGLLREIIKLAAGMFLLGGLWALYGIVTSGKTFYDDWLSLDVDDQKPTGLTDTQKKWREHARKSG